MRKTTIYEERTKQRAIQDELASLKQQRRDVLDRISYIKSMLSLSNAARDVNVMKKELKRLHAQLNYIIERIEEIDV